MRNCSFFLLTIFCCTTGRLFAQTNSSDSTVYRQAIQNSIDTYYKVVGENAHLYNGSEYVPFNYQGNYKNLFFLSDAFQYGSITYDGAIYNNVPLAYDIYHDEVLINKYKQNFRIKLVNNKVDSFSFSGYTFVRITGDSATAVIPGSGFYQRLYTGNVEVFAKRKKKFEENITSNGATSKFVDIDKFFIKKKGIYYQVHNKKSTLQVFKDRKKEVNKLLRKNKVTFKPSLEYGIVKAAEYYDQIQN